MLFEALLGEKYNYHMKPQQCQPVLHTHGPVIVNGVPGSGKTTVIALRCANLALCKGVPAPGILTLSYDKFGCKELERVVRGIFGGDYPDGLQFTTMQCLCSLILRESGLLLNGKPPRMIGEGRRRLLRSLYIEQDGGYRDNRLEELVRSIGRMKNGTLATEQAKRIDDASSGGFSRLYAAYEAYLQANGCIDGDDVPVKALEALNEKPDLLERFRDRYRYISVDEAQDMTKPQRAVLQLLAAPHNNLLLAGNDDQSLTFADGMRDLGKLFPNAAVMAMERNYRSTHAIVGAATRLIQKNPSRNRINMNTGNEIGMPLEETRLNDYSMLCAHLVTKLKDELGSGNTAILYREDASAMAILDALDREGIPYSVRGNAASFFDHWAVKDILAFLALGSNPADKVALKRIYAKLGMEVNREEYNRAAAMLDDGSSKDGLEALFGSRCSAGNNALWLKKMRDGIARLPAMDPGGRVAFICNKLGYGEFMSKVGGGILHSSSLMQQVESLKHIVSHEKSHKALLERIAALATKAENTTDNPDANAVTLCSLRMARGTEFNRVFVIDLLEGMFPGPYTVKEMNDGRKKPMEQERRLVYQAVTRAGKHLELVYASVISGEKVRPSRFVRELLPLASTNRAAKASRIAPAEMKSKPPTGGRKAVRKAGEKINISQKQSSAGQYSLAVGTEIEHKAFGQGRIYAYDDKTDIVTVKFDVQGMKTFAASYCMSGGILKKSVQDDSAMAHS